jgi:hypothetical protein
MKRESRVGAIDRQDGWVGAVELAEGAMGDPPGPMVTVPPYASRRRFARR